MTEEEMLLECLKGTMFRSREDFIANFPRLVAEGVIINVTSRRYGMQYHVTTPIRYVSRWENSDSAGYTEITGTRVLTVTSKERDYLRNIGFTMAYA